MRLLDKENLRLDMTKLGFEQESLTKFEKAILKPYGMVLVTGPTGSGKTNTLYSSIARLNTPDTNIMTAEDPVEFQLAGVNQVQMKEQIGLNFAAALRAFCGRTRTSFWSVKSATLKPLKLPSRPPLPATWCCPRCTPTALRKPSPA